MLRNDSNRATTTAELAHATKFYGECMDRFSAESFGGQAPRSPADAPICCEWYERNSEFIRRHNPEAKALYDAKDMRGTAYVSMFCDVEPAMRRTGKLHCDALRESRTSPFACARPQCWCIPATAMFAAVLPPPVLACAFALFWPRAGKRIVQ